MVERKMIIDIKARIDRMIDDEGSKAKAIASANIGGAFAIHGLRVIGSAKGLFVQMPQTSYGKDGRRLYSDIPPSPPRRAAS